MGPSPLEALIPLGAFAMFAWIVYVIVDSFRRRQQLRMLGEFHGKLLERVGSTGELTEFFNTRGGERFLDSFNVEKGTSTSPQGRILRAVQVGTVLLALGLGLLAYAAVHTPSLSRDAANGLMFFDAIVFSLGAGLLISAWASFRLSKRMGLLDAPEQDGPAVQ